MEKKPADFKKLLLEILKERGLPENVKLIRGVSRGPDEEIVEEYWVFKPFVKVVIVKNLSTQEITYKIFEPSLNEEEFKILEEIYTTMKDLLILRNIGVAIEEKEKVLVEAYDNILRDLGIELTPELYMKYLYYLSREFIGLGPIEPLMADPEIEDIHCDGYDIPVFIYHRKYANIRTALSFDSSILDKYVISIVQRTGKHISYGNPVIDANLADGSRLQATFGTEITPKGSSFTIRKFSPDPYTPVDLITFGTYSPIELAYLWLCVEHKLSIMVVGETASGKTTTLNAVMMFLPPDAKVISIEDTREIQLHHENWLAEVTREQIGFEAEEGQITMYDLLKASMRQRPDYIIVGEVRGEEAQVLFQAISTGHACYSTLHAGDVNQVIYRLENEPLAVPRSMIQLLDVICVQTQYRKDGFRLRRCREINEILGVDLSTKDLLVNKIFEWNPKEDAHLQVYTPGKLEKISSLSGIPVEDLSFELEKRAKLLEYMVENRIRGFVDVTSIIRTYYRNPGMSGMEIIEYAMEEAGSS